MKFSNYYSLELQAIRKEPLTVYGDGKQTRSFQYVSDLVWQLCISMYLSHEISLFSGTSLVHKNIFDVFHLLLRTSNCCIGLMDAAYILCWHKSYIDHEPNSQMISLFDGEVKLVFNFRHETEASK